MTLNINKSVSMIFALWQVLDVLFLVDNKVKAVDKHASTRFMGVGFKISNKLHFGKHVENITITKSRSIIHFLTR